MISRLLDRLFGKRYRKGWPRGVEPVAPFLEEVRLQYPDLWERTKRLPAADGIADLRKAGVL